MNLGVVIKHNRLENFLLSVGIVSLLFIGILIIGFAAYPLLKDQSFESNENEVLNIHTSSYKKGSPTFYPVGALDWGTNNFRIENTSNENIHTFFVLKVQNYWCSEVDVEYSFDGLEKKQIILKKSSNGVLKIPIIIKNKENIFLDLNLMSAYKNCPDTLDNEFPLSINQWSFREK